jgi:dipeptidyl aminopeptidase/acylaminoacyl peptidase
MDLSSRKALALAPLGAGYVNDFAVSGDGVRVAAQWSSAAAPWSIRIAGTGGSEWRDAHPTRVASARLERDEVLRIPGPHGEIPATLLRPKTPGRVPLVLHVHGGPEDQERRMYHALRQYLVAHGVAVLVPNIHGSTGYGSSYQRSIHRDWGGVDLADLDALARWASAQDWVDARRLGIYGGSYGGFATLSAATRLPGYWRVAAEAFGPSDLVTMARSDAPSWQRFVRRWVGDPDRDAATLRARSPLTYAADLACPLLVLQGTRDPRVAKSESDQMVRRLRELGKDVTYVEQEGAGHGWTTRRMYRDAYGRIGDFLLSHLAAETPAATAAGARRG